MRPMQSFLGTVVLFAVAMATPMVAAVAQEQGACGQIRAACMAAGFVQGAGRDGIGLQVHCMMPIMLARPQPASARKPLPQVSPQLVADCRTTSARFARSVLPSEAVVPPLPLPPPVNDNPPASPPSARAPTVAGQDMVLRPPNPMTSEQRSVIAALPPEEQPETGPAKALAPQFRRTTIDYPTKEPAGTIIVDTAHTYLYLVLGNGKAVRYGIGVGREGFTWSGAEKVTKMAEWPDWHPPEAMIERQPYLPRFMAGGEGNPLGARALYLGQTLYRIHGTNQPSTIGTFVSSGCIRLTNEDITDLHGRVRVGTRVVVLPATSPAAANADLSARPAAPPRPRPKPAAAEKPAPAPAPAAPTQASSVQGAASSGAMASKDMTPGIAAAPAAAVSPPNEEE
jgi:lipoprotein-anchoring transpeptidase ErfK/SrfK